MRAISEATFHVFVKNRGGIGPGRSAEHGQAFRTGRKGLEREGGSGEVYTFCLF